MASTKSPSVALLDGQAPPRVRHAPRVRANGWEDVADLSASLGVTLDEWQEAVLEAAMGERHDGRWAARLVGVSAARQQGKSQLIVARALAGILLFEEETIICSAHQTDTAREVFQRLLDIIDENPGLQRRVDSVMKAINREHIRFKSGQVIRIKARSLAGGRGFSSDCLLLDEAQILGAPAWASILPTMSARDNPQAWLLGTPPTSSDDGEVFARLRQSGLDGNDSRSAWIEWSADEGDDFDDPATWAKANPSLGTRISVEAIEAERASMTNEQFGMERLGMWRVSHADGVIPSQSWASQEDSGSVPVEDFALGVEVGPDMAWASVALAGIRADGGRHIELEEDQHTKGRGVSWLAPHVEALVEANPQIRAVVVDVGGPIAPLLIERNGRYWLRSADGSRGVEVTPLKVKELGAGCASLLNGIVVGEVWHIGQPQLSAAALAATKRNLADTGMWVWHRRAAESDITPIQSCTYALIGADMTRPKRPRMVGARSNSRRGGREAVVL